MTSQKRIHSLIVDTGPLIKNDVSISTMVQSAEHIYTTSAVLSEVKDPATRSRVETALLPFLTIRNPTPANYEFVAQFSKKTGDFPVLSRQDLGILALAYEIEQEMKKEVGKADEEGEEQGGVQSEEQSSRDVASEAINEAEGREEVSAPTEEQPSKGDLSEVTKQEATVEDLVTHMSSQADSKEDGSTAMAEKSGEPEAPSATEPLENGVANMQISSEDSQEYPVSLEEDDDNDDDDDDDGEWITPGNLKKHQAKDSGVSIKATEPKQLSTATITTDFAMQNVLLQLHLNLVSSTMQRIKQLKTFILRCHACFLTTKEMDKQFCPRCGQPALQRVSCHTNAKGEFKINLKKNFQWNNRGNRYSVPKPVSGATSVRHMKGGGKGGWGRDLVLAEDQKEYTRAMDENKRSKTRDLMDEDYLPGILTGDRGRAGGRPKVGAGKNVNSRKRV